MSYKPLWGILSNLQCGCNWGTNINWWDFAVSR